MQEDFDEFLIDAKLHIETTGRDDQYSDTYRYPYEPTAYSVLARIAESGFITEEDLLIDYGSGKGRVPIYFNNKVGCRAIGIEMMEELFFYYPQDEYVAYLMGVNELDFVDEIDCMDLFAEHDDRNRVMIFELP